MNLTEEADKISCISGKTTLRTEEKQVEWTIEHFSSVMRQKLPDVKFTFDLGEGIGMPSTFNIYLEYEAGVARFKTSCHKKNQPEDIVCVTFDASLTHGSRKLFSVEGQSNSAGGWIGVQPSKDDTAVIQIKLTLFGNEAVLVSDQAEINVILKEKSTHKITEDMQQLLDSGDNSDFVIKVPSDGAASGYESFKVHKNILAARSEVFKVMFETPMLESQSGEANFEGVSPEALKIFLKFLYTGTVDGNWKENATEVLDAANQFSLPTLKEFVDMNLHLLCDVKNATDLLQMTKIYGLATAFKNVVKFIQSNVHEIVKDL